MQYLRNIWYAAGWSHEFSEQLNHRTMLGEDILIYRHDGRIHAISDTCPHRFAPLHMGRLVDGAVECRYHGLRFGTDGTCVHNPHAGGRARTSVRVSTYPAFERHGLVWLWMGERERADPGLLPNLWFLDDPAYAVVSGTIEGEGNYELFSDNILDLGHADYLHSGLASRAFTIGSRKVWQDDNTLHMTIVHPDDVPSPVSQAIINRFDERLDFVGTIAWHAPATMTFHSSYTTPGEPQPELPSFTSLHLFTPMTEGRTRYYWSLGRINDHGDEDLSTRIRDGLTYAFEKEDKPMISAIAGRMAGREFWVMRPLLLPTDESAVRARRLLARLIEEERKEVSDTQNDEDPEDLKVGYVYAG